MNIYEGYALTTGGNSGIGLESANQLLASGFRFFLINSALTHENKFFIIPPFKYHRIN